MKAIQRFPFQRDPMLVRLALITGSFALLLAAVVQAAEPSEKTKSLVAVLQSEAPLFDKARACQQLGESGTPDAVPVLAGLLTDPKLSAYARSGLEGISDPSAAAALREAISKTQGPLLAGIVTSLGTLRDPQAVEFLAELAVDPASGVVKEAFLALGNISTPASIRVLEAALNREPEPARAEAAAACLLAADQQRINGDGSVALRLYDQIRKAEVPIACRAGATRGAILVRKDDRVPFLLEQLRSDELAIRNAALLTIRDVPDEALAAVLNAEIPRAKAELQGQLLLALADCHNAESLPVTQALASSPEPAVRKTALSVLGRLGPNGAPALISALGEDRPAEERAIVLNGLRGLEGSAVDDLLVRALNAPRPPAAQAELIRILETRGVTNAAPAILNQAEARDKQVQVASLSALRTLASSNEMAGLIRLTKATLDEEVREAAEGALAGLCVRSGDAVSETVLQELKQAARAVERIAWIRVLARAGYAGALPSIESAASDPDPVVADNALAELGRWPNPAPMETLLKTMDSGASPSLRKRAMASALDLASTAVDDGTAPDSTLVAWLRRVRPAAQSTSDKVRIISLLGRLKSVESFRLLESYLEDPGVQPEAASAVVQIAPALAKGKEGGKLKTALTQIAATVANPDLRQRALEIAKAIPGPAAPVSMADGRTLRGWEGDTNVWRVRDGEIVGGSLEGNPRNEFLATTRHYTNFVLRLEYKLVGSDGFVNSGLQFRSVRISNPPNEMSGYQADIGAGYSGCLYDESRRNNFLARPSNAVIKRLEKAGEWNQYEIRCEGPRIQIWLNGEKTVDYTEPVAAIPQSGLIGLQIHGGNKAEVSFRNITIQEL